MATLEERTKPVPPRPPSPIQRENKTIVGQGIVITGEVTGNGDVEVRGEIIGSITLPNNIAYIDKSGVAKSTINAREVDILGRVEGDVCGTEVVRMRKGSSIAGNVTAPQVSLEAGALFKGSVDMQSVEGSGNAEPVRRPQAPPPQQRPVQGNHPPQGSGKPQPNPSAMSGGKS